MPETEKTCCVLTASGRGAVAVISVESQSVHADVARLFDPVGSKGYDIRSPEICYGNWAGGEDLIVRRISNKQLEIHCHGGQAAPQAILESLQESGYRALDQAERSFSQSVSPWVSDASKTLTQAATEKTARITLNLQQSIQRRIDHLAQLIQQDTQRAIQLIDRSLAWSDFGLHLTQPYSVVLLSLIHI